MPLDARTEKAFVFASDLAKQLITLATGILTVTITFGDKLVGMVKGPTRWLLGGAWTIYLLSILFGIWMLMALTGTLAPIAKSSDQPAEPAITGENVRLPAMLQILSFLVATLFVVVFGLAVAFG
jgi:hypothetical protein